MQELKLVIEYTKGLNVLYVEDEKIIRDSTKELLEIYFTSVEIAVDGQDALAKYISFNEENNFFYDLIITDLEMPNMCGLDFSQRVIKLNATQSIIVITAHNEVQLLSRAIELNVSSYIQKPIDNKQLLKVLYKTAQAICDHKFVEEHLGMMEEMNLKLETQNRELKLRNEQYEKSSRILDTAIHKEQLLSIDTQNETMEICPHLIDHDLDELVDIFTEIDISVFEIIKDDSYFCIKVSEHLQTLFTRYGEIADTCDSLENFSKEMIAFSNVLKLVDISNKKFIRKIFTVMESILFSLNSWHKEVPESREDQMPQFDKAIEHDLHSVVYMINNKAQ